MGHRQRGGLCGQLREIEEENEVLEGDWKASLGLLPILRLRHGTSIITMRVAVLYHTAFDTLQVIVGVCVTANAASNQV
jgi:hypothetical protein